MFAGSRLNTSAREIAGKDIRQLSAVLGSVGTIALPLSRGKVFRIGSEVLSLTLGELRDIGFCLSGSSLGEEREDLRRLDEHVLLGRCPADRWHMGVAIPENDVDVFEGSLEELFKEIRKETRCLERTGVRDLLRLPTVSLRHGIDSEGGEDGIYHTMAVIGQAHALLDWRAANRFCPTCGSKVKAIEGGVKVTCTEESCRYRGYPRLDPVVIMAVYDTKSERCLVGRQRGYPKGMYTLLSGFVDQGESIEEAVVREVMEEGGVAVDINSVHIALSQPWPIGRAQSNQLMIGCIAQASSDDLEVNKTEMEDVKWITVEELREAHARTNQSTTALGLGGDAAAMMKSGDLWVPPRYALANRVMETLLAKH